MKFIYYLKFKENKKIFYYIFLFFFSILFNQYYGYIGIQPVDSFTVFNSGYEVINGYYPFKDYWTMTGPLLDVIQALFYKILGISWFSYVFHASVFNFLIAAATFYTLAKFELNINYSLFYAFLVSILSYPTVGTPFVDHHSAILSMIALFSFILALKTKSNFYWFILPIILGLAFLSKQVPASYIFLVIIFLLIIYFSFNFSLKIISFCALGTFVFIFSFILALFFGNISINSFIEQYILFPQSDVFLQNKRFEFLFPFDFQRVILRFKLIYISLLVLMIVCIKKMLEDYKYLKTEEFIIIISLIFSGFALILHQLMTFNTKFIFFSIPIFVGFSHIYYLKYFKEKNYIIFFFIILSFSSTAWYQFTYNENRRFMDLEKTNINSAIDANILDKRFKGLKWITVINPNDPNKEIARLKEAIKIIKNDERNKMIITDYQFISVLLSSSDYSPVRFWHRGISYPQEGAKYFETFRNFFINVLKKNKIKVVYIIKPLYLDGELDSKNGYIDYNVLKPILDKNCLKKTELTDILDGYLLADCIDLI